MPNQDIEERHLALLIEHLRLDQEIRPKKSESPDFLLPMLGQVVGIEHTEVFLDKSFPLQAIESVEDDISFLAQCYADQQGYIPSRTKINFGNIRGLKKSKREALARKITDYVQFNLLLSNRKSFNQIHLKPNAFEVTSIYATVMPEGFENHYFPLRAGWVKPDATTEVKAAIERKASKLNKYKRNCDEIWLLVVADGRNPSSLLGKGGGVQRQETLHGFDRVFFMFHLTKYVQEVLIRN